MAKVLKNISQLVSLQGAWKKDGRNLLPEDLSIIEKGAVAFDLDQILWVGEEKDIPSTYKDAVVIDMKGGTLLPELVDSHTHLVFAGDRSKEYSMRLNGESYQAIADGGGGILSTVGETNRASEEELEELARKRIEKIYNYGVGTIEIKSGYALCLEGERKISRVIHKLKKDLAPKVQIKNTFMAAHARPPGLPDYLSKVVFPLMKELSQENIIDGVDVFHEEGYFNSAEVEEIFSLATELNLPLKIHADEFNNNGGALLGCKFKALSADHLLQTGDEGIKALANSSTVATLLPGTGLFLGHKPAQGKKFLDAGVKVAMASDYNPGSCHCDNILLLASVAAPFYSMNMAQLWASITLNSAHALGLKKQGSIKEGLVPRFSLFKTDSVDKITYQWGGNLANREVAL